MATAEQLKALLRSYVEGDGEQFLTVSMQVTAHAARRGQTRLAQELRELIDEAKRRASQPVVRPTVPIARPVGELADLIHASYPDTRLADMVLSEPARRSLDRVLSEYRQQDKLRAHGMSARRKLLLVGPPGSGKTMTASALAGELKLPLLSVRLDGLITKFMGETAAKLRQVFDAMTATRGVYLFDEFDAIGGDRGRRNDIGEMRRVLNSFLQFLEADDSDSLILAATNHQEILDPALFRRFDDVICYGLPEPGQVQQLVQNRLNSFDLRCVDWEKIKRAALGLSYAEVARASAEAAKVAVLQDRNEIATEELLGALVGAIKHSPTEPKRFEQPMSRQGLPHLIVEGFFSTEKYTATPRRGPEFSLPARDRTAHGTSVREQLQRVRGENEQNRGVQTEPDEPAPISLEVRSEPGFLLKLESLEDRRKGIEVTCVQQDGDVQVATVHVPEGALTHFLKRAEEYLKEDTQKGNPQHQRFVASITQIRLATLRSFWTDNEADFPPLDQSIWWEVWVRTRGDQSPWDLFSTLARDNGLTPGSDTIRFPDRLVGLAHGTANQLMASAELLHMIGEVRRAKENPADFIALQPKEQAEWVQQLLPRITAPPQTAPAICLLDSGVIANPLVLPALNPADCHRFDANWPLTDTSPHGTQMAGVALYGRRLAELLAGNESVALQHWIESVKVLPPPPRSNEPRLYGHITAQAISRVEISAPDRNRSFCMALTTDGTDRGRPSSWSGVIDQQCAGITDENPRLFFISAGNTDPNQRHRYPDSNDTDNVQDPAQAWNAVTVGACTDRVMFDQDKFPGCVPIAPAGDLSPSSATSLCWDRPQPDKPIPWPYKPDIVMEGGNQIVVPGTATVWDPEDMAMLTTAHATTGRLLVDFRDTSAATAQAARIAAILQAEYPMLWPETIRALLIHSAEWTEQMEMAFGTSKADAVNRLRRYGYGVPNLDRARYSAGDSLTLIVQQKIQPFTKEEGGIKTKDMGMHSLPWPKEQLLDLGDQPVTMRVTLSYFIEPKPGRREGFVKYRHRYQSHGLRFEVKRPPETLDDLRKRVSNAAREEEETYEAVGDTSGWVLGPQVRTRGSIHSDWWSGTAADLANCGFITVYPVSGWWRESQGNHWSKEARYALIVSIRTAERRVSLFTPTEIDLYTPIESVIQAAVKPPIATDVVVEDDSDRNGETT